MAESKITISNRICSSAQKDYNLCTCLTRRISWFRTKSQMAIGSQQMNRIRAHFLKHLLRRPWDFCWKVAVEGVIVSIIPAVILVNLLNEPEREFLNWPMPVILAVILVGAPILETLLFQALPITIARWLKAGFKVQILASLVPFALVHLPEGIATGVCAGFVGGFYLAFTYAHWVEKSAWTALWTTTVAHFIRNSFAAALIILGKAF